MPASYTLERDRQWMHLEGKEVGDHTQSLSRIVDRPMV